MAREFKDSGIEWIGQIPKEWKIVPFKAYFTTGKGLSFTKADLTPQGHAVVSYGQVHSKVNTGTRLDDTLLRYIPDSITENGDASRMNKGDFIFADTSEDLEGCGNCVYVDRNMELYAGYHSVTAKPKVQYDNKFLAYYFLTPCWRSQIRSRVTGIKVYSISQSIINKTYIFVPPLSIQQKIADYLDKICGEVDELVAIQETMIEELKAYKQSVITEAVTKGLNPNTPMRNSGIDWIGDIPEHWEAKKLKYIIDYIESGTSVNAGNVPAQTNEFGVLKTSAVSKYVFDATENKTVVSEEMDKVSCPVRKNTIIVSRMNTPELVGACGYVENDYNNIFLPDRLWQVHFVDTVYVKYIWYALRGSNIRNYYSSLSVGSSSSMQNISQSQFSNGSIPIPCDVDEQRAIVSYLDTKCSEIDSLIALKQAKIEELKEYKKSVIYEYVTGKKEVM